MEFWRNCMNAPNFVGPATTAASSRHCKAYMESKVFHVRIELPHLF